MIDIQTISKSDMLSMASIYWDNNTYIRSRTCGIFELDVLWHALIDLFLQRKAEEISQPVYFLSLDIFFAAYREVCKELCVQEKFVD